MSFGFDPDEPARLDMRGAHVLCADANSQGLDILGQVLMGFGVQHIARAQNVAEFQRHVMETPFDLILIEAAVNGNGYELVRWLRREAKGENRTVVVLVIAGHTPRDQVEMARDCGANIVIAKPISADVLLKRIVWSGREPRDFIETPTYAGPDRRFRNLGVPDGLKGRRRDDLSTHVGHAIDPNMSQDEIDTLLRPRKVSL